MITIIIIISSSSLISQDFDISPRCFCVDSSSPQISAILVWSFDMRTFLRLYYYYYYHYYYCYYYYYKRNDNNKHKHNIHSTNTTYYCTRGSAVPGQLTHLSLYISLSLYIYIYIHMYISD